MASKAPSKVAAMFNFALKNVLPLIENSKEVSQFIKNNLKNMKLNNNV